MYVTEKSSIPTHVNDIPVDVHLRHADRLACAKSGRSASL